MGGLISCFLLLFSPIFCCFCDFMGWVYIDRYVWVGLCPAFVLASFTTPTHILYFYDFFFDLLSLERV